MLYQRNANPWIFSPQQKRPHARFRLFCFPYAGGGASVYHEWSKDLPVEIEVCAIQLPGHENRFTEPPYMQLNSLIAELGPAIKPYLDRPFAFFGHSMGALTCFELARQVKRTYGLEPAQLFVAGHRAPHLERQHRPIHALPTEEFIQEIRQLNGTPEAILKNSELLEILLPVLRADFELCETYAYTPQDKLSCSILAMGGLQDIDVSRDALEGWREHTSGNFCRRFFSGDHFFLHQHHQHITHLIAQRLLAEEAACRRCVLSQDRVS